MPSAKVTIIGVAVGVAVTGAALAYKNIAYPQSRYNEINVPTKVSRDRVMLTAADLKPSKDTPSAFLTNKDRDINIFWVRGRDSDRPDYCYVVDKTNRQLYAREEFTIRLLDSQLQRSRTYFTNEVVDQRIAEDLLTGWCYKS